MKDSSLGLLRWAQSCSTKTPEGHDSSSRKTRSAPIYGFKVQGLQFRIYCALRQIPKAFHRQASSLNVACCTTWQSVCMQQEHSKSGAEAAKNTGACSRQYCVQTRPYNTRSTTTITKPGMALNLYSSRSIACQAHPEP